MNRDFPIHYIEPVFRPPSEADSLILPITNGCSWNRCTYCEMYTAPQKKFALRDEDETLESIRRLGQGYGRGVQRVFLGDGDAMALSTRRLMAVLEALRTHLPGVRRISSYCLPRNVRSKSVADLTALREAGLLTARRDGTRTLLRTETHDQAEPILAAALSEGRTLCSRDGSLARIATVVAQREELSRRYFDAAPAPTGERFATPDASLMSYLAVFAPLLPGHALAVDLGTGDGQLLPMLSPIFDRIIAVDRSPARLARCAARVAQLGLPNVRLREGDADDADAGSIRLDQ